MSCDSKTKLAELRGVAARLDDNADDAKRLGAAAGRLDAALSDCKRVEASLDPAPGKPRGAKEGDLVLVRWRDSSGCSMWTDKAAAYEHVAKECVAVETVGWILRRTKAVLTVYQSVTRDCDPPSIDHQMTIPTEVVDRVEVLRRGK